MTSVGCGHPHREYYIIFRPAMQGGIAFLRTGNTIDVFTGDT